VIYAVTRYLATVTGWTTGEVLFGGFLPQDAPDTCIAVIRAGGSGMGSPHLRERGTWIVRVIARSTSYAEADAASQTAYMALHEKSAIVLVDELGEPAFVIGGVRATAMPQSLGMDERRRHRIAATYILIGQQIAAAPFYGLIGSATAGRYARGSSATDFFSASEARTVGVWVNPASLPGHHVIFAPGKLNVDAISITTKYANTVLGLGAGAVLVRFVFSGASAVLDIDEWSLVIGTYNGGPKDQLASYTFYRGHGGAITNIVLNTCNVSAGQDLSANMVTLLANSATAPPSQPVSATVAQAFAYADVWDHTDVTTYYTGGYADVQDYAAGPRLYYRLTRDPGHGQIVRAIAGPDLVLGDIYGADARDPIWTPEAGWTALGTSGPL
jgi:hypothetical protein